MLDLGPELAGTCLNGQSFLFRSMHALRAVFHAVLLGAVSEDDGGLVAVPMHDCLAPERKRSLMLAVEEL